MNRVALSIAAGAWCATAAVAEVYVGGGAVIPDAPSLEGPPASVTSDIEVPDALVIEDITVTVNGIVHSWVGDIIFEVTHLESGATQTLVYRIGLPPDPPKNTFGDSSNYDGDYSFNDGSVTNIWKAAAMGDTNFTVPPGTYHPSGAGSSAPVSLLAVFGGLSSQGTWRLTVSDAAAGDMGSFEGWTLEIVGDEVEGCPGQGDCCTAHAGAGCADVSCCAAVCAVDASCCDTAWDALCAESAADLCPECGPSCPGTGSCFQPHAGPGCDDAGCCEAVCDVEPACCETGWDADCVAEAVALCGNCGDAGAGCCFTASAGPGCSDATCCELVCARDAACCEVAWDFSCAVEAFAACCPSDLNGNGMVEGADIGILLANWGEPGATDIDCNGNTDGLDLGVLLSAWGACGQ